jgi:hypothetical protein
VVAAPSNCPRCVRSEVAAFALLLAEKGLVAPPFATDARIRLGTLVWVSTSLHAQLAPIGNLV